MRVIFLFENGWSLVLFFQNLPPDQSFSISNRKLKDFLLMMKQTAYDEPKVSKILDQARSLID